MKYNRFIKEAPMVSEIGFGAWQLGVNSGWKGLTEKEVNEMIQKALELGMNFFDTAPNYGNGTSESRLGKALKQIDRSNIVINTKFGHTDTGKTNYNSNYIRESLEGSLKRLQVDYVDSLIIHNPPFEYIDGNKNDHYEILERLKEEGKIKAYGASLDTYKEMKLFMETTNCEVIEAFFNILHQDASRAFGMAQEKGVGIIAKIPLDSGWLSGRYNENSVFNGIRTRWSKDDIKTRAALVGKIKNLIPEGHALAQIALAFCVAYDAVATVIPGNASITQLESNIESVKNPISKELVDTLEKFYQTEVKDLNLPW
ncbi:aldo/keto reductase [Maribacter polysaccharolyticus]|uniref:aldo/keto reductase n=1 Tax=Maribacter polysaccharolyticus TaxID=3020831 RepID=UPI00237F2504|nr:aldo/keto reductase [Maribacter polysaccharolyticus]MDE3741278.1 aldo/keto reductase [Maribacter polysaccharolyticus]